MSTKCRFVCCLAVGLWFHLAIASSSLGGHHAIRSLPTVDRRQDSLNLSLVQISSPDNVNSVIASNNGNLYLDPAAANTSTPSTYFISDSLGDVYGDESQRVLHIYTAEMEAYGVSRLRLHNVTELPKTSIVVTLIPIANKATNGSTLAITTSDGKFHYLAACNIENQYTKIFAIESYPGGLATLESAAMQTVVTGGIVDTCVLINLTNGVPGRPS